MKVKQLKRLIELNHLGDDDVIGIRIVTRDKNDKIQHNSFKIWGIDDTTNAGEWEILGIEFGKDESLWQPSIDWDKEIEREECFEKYGTLKDD